ncbi:endoglucanase [Novosphingobium chloroacetimidivorans]|uniref:Endoglucanase n=1 Tax=Novosphingobium chloroacetimidivorans TaxID=1428314 RepID=A0A7W7KDW8_9SPHN|nr:glycoside hydrolase family 5 protein [Novosphingobium chloroacetimidivorans]MBB4861062.1 endoglucanase [Novosphingobium chloroacetimidivorans]
MIDKFVSIKMIGGVATVGLAVGAVATQDTRLTNNTIAMASTSGSSTALQTTVTTNAAASSDTGTTLSSAVTSSSTATNPQNASAQRLSSPDAQAVPLPIPGVNLSGGEFGTVPGRLGFNYTYPSTTDIDYIAAQGFKMVRIPFRWERLQPILNGALSTADASALMKATDYALSKGLVVVLDMHDFARRRPNPTSVTSAIVGSADVPAAAFADAWVKIAGRYRGNNNVWLGLMNEPNGLPAASWWQTAQQTAIALRNQGVNNKLMIPGIYWTAAYNWVESGNAAFASTFKDPGENYAFEVHQYLDSDSSGTKPTCAVGAARRVDAVLAWAKVQKVRLFFGEMGAGPDDTCKIEYGNMLAKIDKSQVAIGWTAWGAGSWWNEGYMFRINPIKGAMTSHMQMLQTAMSNR